jgi:ATP-dependent protease ClpP protease subunit
MSFIWRCGRGSRTIVVGMVLTFVSPQLPCAQDDPWKGNLFADLIRLVGWEERCGDVDNTDSCSFRIFISGEITTGTVSRLQKALARWDQREVLFVRLNSPGGDIAAAMTMGRIIRKSRGHTMVEGNATCASACVLIFGAGISRIFFEGAKIGVHRPALAAVPRERDMGAIEVIADQTARELRTYASEMNISQRLIDDMLLVPPDSVRWLSPEERQSYGLGLLDPVYEETATLDGANRYNISPAEYRRRNALAKSSCEWLTEDEIYGILEGKRDKCAEDILAGRKHPFDPTKPFTVEGSPPCADGSQTCKP